MTFSAGGAATRVALPDPLHWWVCDTCGRRKLRRGVPRRCHGAPIRPMGAPWVFVTQAFYRRYTTHEALAALPDDYWVSPKVVERLTAIVEKRQSAGLDRACFEAQQWPDKRLDDQAATYTALRYRALWDLLSPNQRDCLEAVAAAGDECSSRGFRSTPSSLVRRGLLERPRTGVIAATVVGRAVVEAAHDRPPRDPPPPAPPRPEPQEAS